MKPTKIVLLFALGALSQLSGCSAAPARADWSSSDAARQKALYAVLAIDAVTTSRIASNDSVYENAGVARAIMGPEPDAKRAAIYMAGLGVAYHAMVRRMPPRLRRAFQYFAIGDHAALGIVNNCRHDLC